MGRDGWEVNKFSYIFSSFVSIYYDCFGSCYLRLFGLYNGGDTYLGVSIYCGGYFTELLIGDWFFETSSLNKLSLGILGAVFFYFSSTIWTGCSK